MTPLGANKRKHTYRCVKITSEKKDTKTGAEQKRPFFLLMEQKASTSANPAF